MKTYTLLRETIVAASLQDAFAFFQNPSNLARITPPWLNFQITSREPVQMRKGAEIEYRIRWLSLGIKWKTRITEYEPPFYFIDEQESGPYRYWHHQHTFKPAVMGTIVCDRVDYALPLGWLGRAVHWVLVRRQLNQIFDYRQQILSGIFASAPTAR
jgi:ligand-binding SRPBCC domain-containing protein